MPQHESPAQMGCTDCERIRPGLLAQPVNAVTSLSFVVAAAWLARRASLGDPDRRNEMALYSGTLALVGIGSFAFHGPQPRGSQQLHDWPIAALAVLTVGTPLARRALGRVALPGWRRSRGTALGLISVAAAAAYAGGRTSAPTCKPDSLLQLHGAWHTLAAAGFAMAAEILYSRPAEA